MILEQADYSFNAATKEVTFNAPYNTIELQQIELIVNVVDNIIIYQFNKNTKGGTLAGAVLTLTYDTTAMSNGDILMVIVSVASTSSGLTDTELRATPVPVSGTISTGLTQPLTDVQLRATPVPVSGTVAVTGAGDASASNQTSGSQKTQIVDGAGDVADVVPLGTQVTNTDKGVVVNATVHGTPNGGTNYYDWQVKSDGSGLVYANTLPLPAGAATESTLGSIETDTTAIAISTGNIDTSLNEIESAVYTSGDSTIKTVGIGGEESGKIFPLNAITLGGLAILKVAPIDGSGNQVIPLQASDTLTAVTTVDTITNVVHIDDNGGSITVDGTVAVTGAGDATAANQIALNTLTGAVTETAPATDTASSGLNGRLQRIAQRITSLITALGSPFQAGGSIGNTAFGVNNAAGASAVNIQDGGNSVTVDSPQLPAALVTGRLDVNVGARAVSTPTKTGGNSIITLQSVAASSVLVSSAVDVSTKWKASLNVFFGRRSATAAGAGVNIYIEGSTFASGDDNWTTLAQYTTGFAAAEAEAVTGTVAAGATVITCASTTNLTAQDYIYIDNGTIANSEWRRIKSIVAATSVTVIDALTNAQTSSTMYDSAETYNADLDLSSIMRIRVVADGSLYTQAFAIKVTSTYLDSIV
jgi:hypothetical protein